MKGAETGTPRRVRYEKRKRAAIAGRPFCFEIKFSLRLDQGRGRLVLERGFGDIHDFRECGGISRGDVG